jgi:hypothetical protein
LSDLPEIIGISRPMLFSYRSGKNRITPKAWHKLEDAERAAGIAEMKGTPVVPFVESEGKVNEPEPDYGGKDVGGPPALIEVLLRIAVALEGIERKMPPNELNSGIIN